MEAWKDELGREGNGFIDVEGVIMRKGTRFFGQTVRWRGARVEAGGAQYDITRNCWKVKVNGGRCVFPRNPRGWVIVGRKGGRRKVGALPPRSDVVSKPLPAPLCLGLGDWGMIQRLERVS